MVWAVRPACSHAPQVRGKDDHRQEEEDARHLEPDDAADAPKRPQEPADALGDGFSRRNNGASRSRSGILNGIRGWSRLSGDLPLGRRCGLPRASQLLPRHAPRDAQPDTQGSPNGLWSHSVYDGSSDPG